MTIGDPVASVVLALAVILAGAKLGGHLAERIGQPAVLGELAVGIVLGNLDLFGVTWFRTLASDGTINVLAQLGAVVLLFGVGLESTIGDMLHVGARSFVVATLGIVIPWVLGWWVGAALLPERSVYVHAFLGAVLTATSVGITARVLRDLGRAQSAEGRIILGAAVIDDVLGLVILATITSVIAAADRGSQVSYAGIAIILGKAVVFLFGALTLGTWVSPRLFSRAGQLRGQGLVLATALVFCFLLAYLASAVGLAAIVGAYVAGLVLDQRHDAAFAAPRPMVEQPRLEQLVFLIGTLLVPVFFVLMGMRVELRTFAEVQVLGLAALLTIAAIVGKQACALGALGTRLDGLSIGVGMIPRGEVGLIFASMGLGLTVHGERIIDEGTFSAVVIMVLLTTLVTPSALKWSLARLDGAIVPPHIPE